MSSSPRTCGAGSRTRRRPNAAAIARSRFDDVPLALPRVHARGEASEARGQGRVRLAEACRPCSTKAKEEIDELKAAVEAPDEPRSDRTKRAGEEFGDLLFVMANIARHLGVDPEGALRDANAKFVRRFGHVEDALARHGRKAEDATLEEMDRLWDEAKASERKA